MTPAVLFILVAATPAEQWPQFRGPTGDGRAVNQATPLTWSETDHVAWKVATPGKGHSSPVVWGKQLWITTALKEGRQLQALCFDVDSGTLQRRVQLFDNVQTQHVHKMSSHASPTPVIEAGRLYAHFGSYGTACVNTTTGEILWTRRDLVVDHRHGPGSSPVLADDLLILQFDGMDRQFMIALNKSSGMTVWQRNRDIAYDTENGERKKAFCTPLLIQHAGEQQLVTTAARAAIAYQPATGKELWRVRFIGDSATARPIYGASRMFLITSCVDAKLFAIDPGRHGDITDAGILWRREKGVPKRPSPLFADGLLYCIQDTGVLSCHEPATGKPVWQHRLGGNFAASPVFAGGRIYLCNEEGETFVVAPGRKFEQLAVNKLDAGCMASPAAAHDSLFLRTASHLYRISK